MKAVNSQESETEQTIPKLYSLASGKSIYPYINAKSRI
jgi:hypothetical protein